MFSRSAMICLLGLLAAGCDKQSASSEQAAAPAPDEVTAAPAQPVVPGKPDRSHKGEAAPTAAFTGPDGQPATLARFKGKPLLVNLWATWCAPCVAEMPTLDRAAAALNGKVAVLAVSQDMEGAAKVRPFFAHAKLTALKPYLDPKLGLSLALQANLPTTILYDAQGKEVWRVTGGRDWATPESRALIAEAG